LPSKPLAGNARGAPGPAARGPRGFARSGRRRALERCGAIATMVCTFREPDKAIIGGNASHRADLPRHASPRAAPPACQHARRLGGTPEV